jgi:two-component sensor histidine kinase
MRNLDTAACALIEALPANETRRPDTGPVLVAESNHRIANNLTVVASLVRHQSRALANAERTFSGAEVARILDQVGQRVDMVARFHRLLAQPSTGDSVELGDYLREVAQAAIASMSLAGDIALEAAGTAGCAVHTSQALLVGLIVGEMVMNSVKYAHPAQVKGIIRLSCDVAGSEMLISVADDGVGFPDGFDPETSGGLGLRMSRLLAQQLRGAIEYDSGALGLTARLRIPLRTGATVVPFVPAG